MDETAGALADMSATTALLTQTAGPAPRGHLGDHAGEAEPSGDASLPWRSPPGPTTCRIISPRKYRAGTHWKRWMAATDSLMDQGLEVEEPARSAPNITSLLEGGSEHHAKTNDEEAAQSGDAEQL